METSNSMLAIVSSPGLHHGFPWALPAVVAAMYPKAAAELAETSSNFCRIAWLLQQRPQNWPRNVLVRVRMVRLRIWQLGSMYLESPL